MFRFNWVKLLYNGVPYAPALYSRDAVESCHPSFIGRMAVVRQGEPRRHWVCLAVNVESVPWKGGRPPLARVESRTLKPDDIMDLFICVRPGKGCGLSTARSICLVRANLPCISPRIERDKSHRTITLDPFVQFVRLRLNYLACKYYGWQSKLILTLSVYRISVVFFFLNQ